MRAHFTLLTCFVFALASPGRALADPTAAAIKVQCSSQRQAILQIPTASDGLSGLEREASLDEIITDTLDSSSETLRKENVSRPAAQDVWERFAACAATAVLDTRDGGPLGLKGHPLLPLGDDLLETAEEGDVVVARWRAALRTPESLPKHNPAKEAGRCIDKVWKADNPQAFEYGLLYNKCNFPVRVAYCNVGVDCEANKGSIRTLAPFEATRFGDRDHRNVIKAACTGKIFTTAKVAQYACE